MPGVLLTAFDAYDVWKANASWLCLQRLTRDLPAQARVTTRLYGVDFAACRRRLEDDLRANYDLALFLGQAPGSARVRLESIGLNVGLEAHGSPDDARPLAEDGPVAYRSTLPLCEWAKRLRAAGIPAAVSHHAGTYLCNAMLYWGHYLAERMGLSTQFAFIHLPLEVSQVVGAHVDLPSMPVEMTACAVRLILEELVQPAPQPAARSLA